MCVCTWKPEVNLGRCSSGTVYLVFLRQGLPLAWGSQTKLGWLVGGPQGSAGFCLASAGIARVLGTELRPSHLHGKHFTSTELPPQLEGEGLEPRWDS